VNPADPTLIGTVQDVGSTSISVALLSKTATRSIYFQGKSYRFGLIGSYVRIPIIEASLFGVVSQAGPNAAPIIDKNPNPWSNRWLKINLIAEKGSDGRLKRRVSRLPKIYDPVHIVTEDDLRQLYDRSTLLIL
jgi:hypothetical protein